MGLIRKELKVAGSLGRKDADFYARWKDGQLGDETDFFEWFAYCDTYRRLVEKIHSQHLANQEED